MPEDPSSWGAVPAEEFDPTKAGAIEVQPSFVDKLKEALLTNAKSFMPPSPREMAEATPAPVRDFVTDLATGNLSPQVRDVLRTVFQTKVPVVGPALLGGQDSLEGALELAPAVGGAVGGVVGAGAGGVGAVPGATLGATGGEAMRQNIRRAVGLPAAPGMLQSMLKLDPNSPEAATAGLTAEGAAPVVAAGASKVLSAAGGVADRMGLRAIKEILHPSKGLDKQKAMDLAARMRDEGISGTIASREEQIKRANAALSEATADLQAEKNAATAAGTEVSVDKVLEAARKNIPPLLQSGATPETGVAERNAAEKAYRDLTDDIGGRKTIPWEEALQIKERWDDLLQPYYKRKAVTVPEAYDPIKKIADAWRDVLHKARPTAGEALSRKSDLITISKLLPESLKDIQNKGAIDILGRGLLRIPDSIVRSAGNFGPVAGTVSTVTTLASKLLNAGGAAAKLGQALMDSINAGQIDKNEPAPADLTDLLGGSQEPAVPMPSASPVSEGEFLKRYQK